MKNNSISEFERLNLNQFKFLKPRKKINFKIFFYILFFILNLLFILIIIYILFLLKKDLLEKILNKPINNNQLIEKLDLIDLKLIIMLQNQKRFKNKRKLNIYDLIRPMEVLGHKKIRIGRNSDGGYILLDDLKNIKIAYSFGINNEFSFDKDLSDKNIDVFMYDHTIANISINNSRLHWKKIGISGLTTKNENMKTLPQLIKENGHFNEKNMILKIDIESNEWNVFNYLPIYTLKQFKYIVGEFHFSPSKTYNYYFILKKLQSTHQIFHLHCNTAGILIDLDGYKICNSLEISYIIKNGTKFTIDSSIYPIENLDFKNFQQNSDINYILNFI